MRKTSTDSLVTTTYICNNYSSGISTQDGDYDSDDHFDTEHQFLRKDVPRVLDGKIQSLVAEKGFGFIKPAAGGADVFFYALMVDAPFETLAKGQPVKYELDTKADRPRARCVQVDEASSKKRSSQRNARTSPNTSSRDPGCAPTRPAFEHGFITKLQRKKFRGFISSVKHGPEYVFTANSVTGGPRFARLEIGDYVQFLVGEPDVEDPKQPVARAVEVVERKVEIPNDKKINRHPNARKKKPTWR